MPLSVFMLSPVDRFFLTSDVAKRRFVTEPPEGKNRFSGSAPKLPTRITLFTEDMRLTSSDLGLSQRTGVAWQAYEKFH